MLTNQHFPSHIFLSDFNAIFVLTLRSAGLTNSHNIMGKEATIMKCKTFMIILAIWGMLLFSPPFNSAAFAYDNIVDFILKVYPGGPASLIPDDFFK